MYNEIFKQYTAIYHYDFGCFAHILANRHIKLNSSVVHRSNYEIVMRLTF